MKKQKIKQTKVVINSKIKNWLLRHTITVFSCVLIIALGIAALTYADPVTTTIGENISTNDLSVAGNVTSGTWQGSAVGTQYGGTGQDWSAVTQGNIPYFSDTGTLSNLAPGTTGQFLSQGSDGNPTWDNVARTATFVVCANDSLNKTQCDYVCDGVDDQVEIQAAIDALPSDGGKVVLLDGTYNMADSAGPYGSLYITRNNVALEGMGVGTILKASASMTHDAIIRIGCVSNITFRDFLIDCNDHGFVGIRGSFCTGKHLIIENIHFKNSVSSYAIQVGGDSGNMYHDVHIKNCHLENTGGLLANCINNVLIEGCVLKDIHFPSSISSASGCIRTAVCNGVKITDNLIDGSDDGGAISPFANGIDIGVDTSEFVVTGNTVNDVISHAINLQHGSGPGIIANNIIRRPKYECICLEFDDPNHITIANNICDASEMFGIWVTGDTSPTVNPDEIGDHINIIGNIILDCNSGIRLQHIDHTRIADNIIQNISSGAGIVVSSSQYCDIQSNHIEKTCQNGGTADNASIYLTKAEASGVCHECMYNVVRNNHIIEDGTIKPSYAIREQNSVYVHDNNISRNIVYGISNQLTENSGTASVSDGDTIAHGLVSAPTYVNLTSSNADHIVSVTLIDDTNITIGLKDSAGNAVTSDETVYWEAEVR